MLLFEAGTCGVIEHLLADPRRIVQVRALLHTAQQVQYLHWADGKLRSARVVGIHGDHVAVLDTAFNKAFKVHHAAILTDAAAAPTESGSASTSVDLNKPSPPPEVAGGADFRVGHRITFIDKNLEHRVGLMKWHRSTFSDAGPTNSVSGQQSHVDVRIVIWSTTA